LIFCFSREACEGSAIGDRLAGSSINDPREDCFAVATILTALVNPSKTILVLEKSKSSGREVKKNIHGRYNTSLVPDITGDLLQAFGMRKVNQSCMSSARKEDSVLSMVH
jgi:hypothetical protein